MTTRIGTNVDFTEAQIDTFTDEDIEEVAYASKIFLLTFYAYVVIVWALKGCVLIFFRRLKDSFDKWQRVLIYWMMWICAAAFVGCMLTLSLSCLPFSDHWRVRPLPSTECRSKPQDFITLSVTNVVTDAALLFISVPLVWSLKIPPLKKFFIGMLLCEGFFVITAAIVRVSFTAVPGVSIPTIARWGVRELGIFIICVNSMILRAMFRPSFWTAEKNAVLLRQRERPSRYFFRSLRERASGRRHRSQGFRRTIGNSILVWTPKSGNSQDPQRQNQSEKACQVSSSQGKDGSSGEDPPPSLETRTTIQPDLTIGQEAPYSIPWDLEKGPRPSQEAGQQQQLAQRKSGDEQGMTQKSGKEEEALCIEVAQKSQETDKSSVVRPVEDPHE